MPGRHKYFSETPYGTRVSIRIAGQLYQKHFPKGTDQTLMRQWLVDTEIQHRGPEHRVSGAFDKDAARYLQTVSAMPSFADRKREIQAWVEVFKETPRRSITSTMITAQLHAWRQTLAASTVNHRRTALMSLWTRLDGKSARNPVKETPRFPEPTPAPKALDYVSIKAVLAAMGDTQSRARLLVLAYTGLPHTQIAALTPQSIDWQAKTLAVTGRRKGQGTAGRVIPLTPGALTALRAMERTKAWGPFSNSSLRKAFRLACRKALGRDDIRPYDLRHSFGTEVYRRSGDIRATQVLMGHSTPALTHRYTLAAVDPRVQAALKGFGRATR